ncbi:MAG: ribonuclease PH [Spirochaetales bacterium]|nr:ribonuclease PH [Leptospiraceae bacterium]MCP5480639.1 ribonuclease PH [Spirochaetales bacterium]MCP5483991.1 ribonuclease PH [Spirochaetales bacterium]
MSVRARNALRKFEFVLDVPGSAAGNVMVHSGDTCVLCTASIASEVPGWLRDQKPPRGWVTAEYNMLPGSTIERKRRGTDGRGSEIQRLIARVLRQSVDLEKMPGLLITCDCDVIRADGGTRTASINGAFVALALALSAARERGLISENPIVHEVAAISVGIVEGEVVLDLDYALDSRAQVDLNVAMTGELELVEIQGTGETAHFSRAQLDEMLDVATDGIRQIVQTQRSVLSARFS